uniref:Carbohydrate sulfotransferase n=1 Tax=Anopheles atroparvus TaxID=41427 RepID=A0AAG5DK75_ANOAO
MGLARRRTESIGPGHQTPLTRGTVVRWTAVGLLVTAAVLVLILPWPLPYEETVAEIMDERSSYLQEQCRMIAESAGNGSSTGGGYTTQSRQQQQQQPFHNYFLQPRLGLLWCSISKVASTTWMYQFNRWAGVSDEKLAYAASDLKALARMYYPVPTRADVEEIRRDPARYAKSPVVRFMLVRDPIDRFVSAYEDLIVRPQSANYRNLRRFIFREVYGVDVPLEKNGNVTSLPVPSFSDFTEYVLRKVKVLDPHWNSYYNLCDPCFLQPTVIVKLETYERDVAHLLQLLNLSSSSTGYHAEDFATRRLNVNHNREQKTDDGGKRASTMARLAELSGEQFERLYHRFELDFRLFQYDASQYFALFRED